MRKIVFAICSVLFTSMLLPINNGGTCMIKSKIEPVSVQVSRMIDHTFVWVFREGVWWIYEYDEDGKLVNEYPAE